MKQRTLPTYAHRMLAVWEGAVILSWLLRLLVGICPGNATTVATDVHINAVVHRHLVERHRSGLQIPSTGRHVRSLSKEQAWSKLPWQQPADWKAPCGPYLNDLPALILCQRRPGIQWLTVFALTHLHEENYGGWILLNTLTSYHLLGTGVSFVVVVASDDSLRACLRLRLPCYNATGAVDGKYLSGYTYGTWAKVVMTRLVLQALPPDLNMHLSDHDVVYLKKVVQTIDRFAEKFEEFDVLAQYENHPHKGINTGVMFIRNTPRVHAMYDEWLRWANSETHDQDTFHMLIGNMTAIHGEHPKGAAAHNASVARIARYNVPWITKQWCHWCYPLGEYEDCWHDDSSQHCELSHRLYIHTICVADKVKYTQGLGLWFLEAGNPMATNFTAIAAAGLPCAPPHDVAELQVVM